MSCDVKITYIHRVGDLENFAVTHFPIFLIYHRVGDLENFAVTHFPIFLIYHRVGDLEC
jgi:molybdopterin synthase catalytic subunit